MRICFPVSRNEGLDSKVSGHFGSAPMFLVFDTGTREFQEIRKGDGGHSHGACRPLDALGGSSLDAVVVTGIGPGALAGLTRAGLKVYLAGGGTISENVDKLGRGELEECDSTRACAGSGHGHGSHGCGH